MARENLVTHFEQNQAACERLARSAGTAGAGPAAGAGALPRGQRPAAQSLRELRARWTRLLGVLLTRADLEAFPAQMAAAMAGALLCCCASWPPLAGVLDGGDGGRGEGSKQDRRRMAQPQLRMDLHTVHCL